ncbi:MAG: hypothetical protein L3K06_02000 [Thermoplasmata archaeon]|nr:hypothetical protein [Thermoplasmata archaeon]MCI4354121.1 hypothetical protein [Thermoplasmata archaeon]
MFRPPARAVVLTPEEDRRRIRRQRRVVGGLLLTLAGLLFSAGLLPSAPGSLGTALPILGLTLVTVWIGGILLGGATGNRRPSA